MSSARVKLVAVLACAAGSALALIGTGQAWAHGSVATGPGLPAVPIAPTGRDLAPAVGALALVGLAGAVALLATRRVGRVLTAVVLVLAGLGAAWSTVAAVTGLPATAADVAGRAVARTRAVPETIMSTAWPWVCLAAALVVAAAGLVALVAGVGWSGMSGRYERPSADTRAAAQLGAPRSARTTSPGESGALERDAAKAPEDPRDAERLAVARERAARASWDALDRGEDPTLDERAEQAGETHPGSGAPDPRERGDLPQ